MLNAKPRLLDVQGMTSRKTARSKTKPKSANAIADRAARDAKSAGATGSAARGRLTGSQKALRDAAIVARREAGATQKAIGQEFSISSRGVHGVLDEAKLLPSPLDLRPMEIVERLIQGYQRAIADFESLAFSYFEISPPAALAAKRAAMDARERLQDLLMALGKLPDNLELFRAESELHRVVRLMVAKHVEMARGELSPEECRQFLEDVVAGDEPLSEFEDGLG